MQPTVDQFQGQTFITVVYSAKGTRIEVHTEFSDMGGTPETSLWVIYADGLAVEVVNIAEALEQM